MQFLLLILLLPIANCLNDILLNVTEIIKSYCGLIIMRNNVKIEAARDGYDEPREYRPMGFSADEGDIEENEQIV